MCRHLWRSGQRPCASSYVLATGYERNRDEANDVRYEQEKLGLGSEEIEGVFQRAMNGGLLGTDMDAVVNLYHARASYYRRQSDVNGEKMLSYWQCSLQLTCFRSQRVKMDPTEDWSEWRSVCCRKASKRQRKVSYSLVSPTLTKGSQKTLLLQSTRRAICKAVSRNTSSSWCGLRLSTRSL